MKKITRFLKGAAVLTLGFIVPVHALVDAGKI